MLDLDHPLVTSWKCEAKPSTSTVASYTSFDRSALLNSLCSLVSFPDPTTHARKESGDIGAVPWFCKLSNHVTTCILIGWTIDIIDYVHPYTLFHGNTVAWKKTYDASCLILSLLTLVCVLFRPTIPTYSCNSLVAFHTSIGLYWSTCGHVMVRKTKKSLS